MTKARFQRYACRTLGDIIACPFCRELFRAGEVDTCPACGLKLELLSALPPSADAMEEDWPKNPETELLPVLYWQRGRGALVIIGIAGAVAFFLPWVHVTIPELTTLSGYSLARILGWSWGCMIGWLTLIPTVLSRRSVATMRGARVAVGLFCCVPLVTAAVLWLAPPRGGIVPIRFDYGLGFYLTAALSVVGFAFAVRFGGRLDELPMSRGTGKGRLLH